jgi:serine/threonine-protein kinase
MALSNIDYNEFDKYEDLNIKKPPQQKNTENFQELEEIITSTNNVHKSEDIISSTNNVQKSEDIIDCEKSMQELEDIIDCEKNMQELEDIIDNNIANIYQATTQNTKETTTIPYSKKTLLDSSENLETVCRIEKNSNSKTNVFTIQESGQVLQQDNNSLKTPNVTSIEKSPSPLKNDEPCADQTSPIEKRYKIIEKVGQGGMGSVYKAIDKKLNRLVALKIMITKGNVKPEKIQRFIREAALIATFKHPSIVTIYDIQQDEDKICYCMDFIEGDTLEKIISLKGKFTEKEALRAIIRIAQTLQIVHAHGIIHRDIKPSNIIVTPNNEIKLLDFGTAKLEGEKSITQTGAFLGTLAFASPEQLNKSSEVDLRTDIYSLGITFYYLLTGEPPYRGTSFEVISQHYFAPIPPLPNGITSHTEKILQKMMAKNPSDRYSSMTELLEAIAYGANQKKYSTTTADEKTYTTTKSPSLWSHYIINNEEYFQKNIKKITYRDKQSGQTILDMTAPAWCKLPIKLQKKYSQLYQLIYAKSYGLEVESTFYTNDISITMRLIPPGRFLMGENINEKYKQINEIPQHIVVISKPFWMAKYPITKKQWKIVTKETPWRGQLYTLSNNDSPATYISWNDICENFLPRLDNEYELPTEAQWEYACRAGTTTPYFWGNEQKKIDSYAWYKQNTAQREYAQNIGNKKTNPWGMADIIGNIWEKCNDIFDKYTIDQAKDPQGGKQGVFRIERGASWQSNASECRSARRSFSKPTTKESTTGFRLIRNIHM